MAQFDIYAGIGRTKSYVVDLQAGLLERLALRIVAPRRFTSVRSLPTR